MVDVVYKILEFVIVFIVVYGISYVVGFRKIKKFDRKKVPANVNYLMIKYKLDIVKLGYKKVYKTLMLCDSFILASLFTITSFIKNIYIRLGVCFILIFPIFALVYYFAGKYYKRKEDE